MTAADETLSGWRLVLDYTPFPDLWKGLRAQWQIPPRSGVYRAVPPWVYRHPRFFGAAHLTGGSVAATAGLICLAYGAYGWGAFFLVIAALHIAGGSWYLTIDRPAAA